MQGVVGGGKFFTVSVGIAGVGWIEIVVVGVVRALADLVSLLSGSTWLSSVLCVLSVLVVYSERRPSECGCHDWGGIYISSPKPVEGRECVIERE